jgi:hypothetical protein
MKESYLYSMYVIEDIFVRFEVFTAVTLKYAVFWDVAPCRSCVTLRFGGTFRLHLQGKNPRARNQLEQVAEDGGDTFLRNFGSHKIYTAPHPRRRHSSKYGSFNTIMYF